MKKQVGQNTRRSWRWWLIPDCAGSCRLRLFLGRGGAGLSSIAGNVAYYDLTGQPAAPQGIVVGVAGTDAWNSHVDSTGAYQLKGIPAGIHRIVVKEVKGLPANAVFITDPPGGVQVKLDAGIPMIDVNLSAVAMPGLPDL